MAITFSIVTPIKNGSQYIESYAATLQSQTYCHWRAIVVDDGSADDSLSKLLVLAASDSRFSILQREGPDCEGPSMARNLALNRVDGDYVCFLDIDDEWHPCRLSVYAGILRSDDAIGLVYSAYVRAVIDANCGKVRDPSSFWPPRLWSYVVNPIPMLTACVKRELIANLRFEAARHEDYLFWFALLQRLPLSQIRLCSRPLSVYRIHRQSLSANKIKVVFWIYSCYRRLGRRRATAVALLLIRGGIQLFLYGRELFMRPVDFRDSLLYKL